jgi:predicted ferric reductase
MYLFNLKEKGFLSVEEIRNFVDIKDDIDVYFCGPKPMRENLKKQFKDSKFRILNFNYEHFQFK